VKLFSYLKLRSIEERLSIIFPDAPQSRVVQSEELDVDSAINHLNVKMAEVSVQCKSTKEHAIVESLRHEINAFFYMR